jgi:hypothetical protein
MDEIAVRRGRRDLDAEWEPLARSSREALALLGYAITIRCLPGEPGPCGATFAQHAAAHLATMQAVIEHHLSHLGDDPEWAALVDDVREHAAEEVSHW